MKKLFMILHMVLILCFIVGCQDKEAMAELEAMKAQADIEEQNKAIFRHFTEELNKGNIEVFNEFFAVKDRVIARISTTGTFTGDYYGIPATGNKVESSAIFVARIENGK